MNTVSNRWRRRRKFWWFVVGFFIENVVFECKNVKIFACGALKSLWRLYFFAPAAGYSPSNVRPIILSSNHRLSSDFSNLHAAIALSTHELVREAVYQYRPPWNKTEARNGRFGFGTLLNGLRHSALLWNAVQHSGSIVSDPAEVPIDYFMMISIDFTRFRVDSQWFARC